MTNERLTNEELVELIKKGDDGLLPQLWEQIRNFVAMMAIRYYNGFPNKHGCELDDLIQSGYFGVIRAIGYYEAKRKLKFTTYLNFTLKSAFREALGIRTSKRDWLDYADSLDRPIGEEDDFTLLDAIGNLMPGDAEVKEDVAVTVCERVYNQELRTALDEAMMILTENQYKLLQMRYYFGMTFEQIAEIRKCSKSNISMQHEEALDRIYYSKHQKVLRTFLLHDNSEINLYRCTGYRSWKDTGSSSVERFSSFLI